MATLGIPSLAEPRTALLERLVATEGAPVDTEFVKRFQQLIETLEAIAADPAVTAQERSAAQRMLDKVATLIRGHAPRLIRKVIEIAGDAAAPASREEAQRLLDDITERDAASLRQAALIAA